MDGGNGGLNYLIYQLLTEATSGLVITKDSQPIDQENLTKLLQKKKIFDLWRDFQRSLCLHSLNPYPND